MAESFISKVAAAALASFDTVMEYCGMVGGKDQGREYLALNPKRSDSKLGSLSTNRDSGAGGDFATGETWGELVALTAWRFDCAQLEAAERLAVVLGIAIPARQKRAASAKPGAGNSSTATAPKKAPQAPKNPQSGTDNDGWKCLIPVPANAPAIPASNPRQGRPSIRYQYRTEAGELAFMIDRYEGKAGKSFGQLTYWQHENGRGEWRWKSAPVPRLLYGLDLLAARPTAPVLVCEGEKAVEAACLLFPNFVCISWPGGANAVDKAGWLPLAGRDVTLWPDLDEAGATCMAKLAGILVALPKPPAALHQVQPQVFGLTEKGDDVADLAGWDAARSADVCTREVWRVAVQIPEAAQTKPSEKKASGKDGVPTIRGGFTLDPDGVRTVEISRDGEESARWICSFLEPLARVTPGGGADRDEFALHPSAVILLIAYCRATNTPWREQAESIIELGKLPPNEQIRHWQMACMQKGIQPWQVLTIAASMDGKDCSLCTHLLTRQFAEGNGRRQFHWACGKGYLILETGRGTERIWIAPPECQSFERWYPSDKR